MPRPTSYSVLEIQPRSLCLLGKYFTSWATVQHFFNSWSITVLTYQALNLLEQTHSKPGVEIQVCYHSCQWHWWQCQWGSPLGCHWCPLHVPSTAKAIRGQSHLKICLGDDTTGGHYASTAARTSWGQTCIVPLPRWSQPNPEMSGDAVAESHPSSRWGLVLSMQLLVQLIHRENTGGSRNKAWWLPHRSLWTEPRSKASCVQIENIHLLNTIVLVNDTIFFYKL